MGCRKTTLFCIVMLKKFLRLKKNIAFKATYKHKNVKSNESLILYVGKEKDNLAIPTKVGFVVSKKIHKRAVKRNKIKRRLREAYKFFLNSGKFEHLQKYISLVFVAKSQCLDMNLNEIKNSMISISIE